MTLGRCPLSIFCSRGTPPEPTNPESIITCSNSLTKPHMEKSTRPSAARVAQPAPAFQITPGIADCVLDWCDEITFDARWVARKASTIISHDAFIDQF